MFKNYKKITPAEPAPAPFDNDDIANAWAAPAPAPEPVVPESLFSDPAPVSNFTPVSHTPAPVGSVRNVLNSDVSVVGTLRFTDDLLVDGSVEGEITSDGVLTVGTNASIQAEIKTRSAIIHGRVTGNVTVTDRVELSSTAELVGDVIASSLAIQAGAVFIGRSTVGSPQSIPTPVMDTKKHKAEDKPAADLLG